MKPLLGLISAGLLMVLMIVFFVMIRSDNEEKNYPKLRQEELKYYDLLASLPPESEKAEPIIIRHEHIPVIVFNLDEQRRRRQPDGTHTNMPDYGLVIGDYNQQKESQFFDLTEWDHSGNGNRVLKPLIPLSSIEYAVVTTNWIGEAAGIYTKSCTGYVGYAKASIYRIADRKFLFSKTFDHLPPMTIGGPFTSDGCSDALNELLKWIWLGFPDKKVSYGN